MNTNNTKSILRQIKTGLRQQAPLLLFLIAVSLVYIGVVRLKEKEEQTLVMKAKIETLKDKKMENTRTGQEGVIGQSNLSKPTILPEYEEIYRENTDFIGWLSIVDTSIDYPVVQKLDDENYYLTHDFDKKENINGCLIMDSDSTVGIGTEENSYKEGKMPSTNLIIHGHDMKSGEMFGDLKLFKSEAYYKRHNIIYFDTLYEKRKYEIMVVFLSQVYKKSDDVFKYYNFNHAYNEEEFNGFYGKIKEEALFDTEVTAEFGDELITLSTCSNHIENGRLVVVGKRIK